MKNYTLIQQGNLIVLLSVEPLTYEQALKLKEQYPKETNTKIISLKEISNEN